MSSNLQQIQGQQLLQQQQAPSRQTVIITVFIYLSIFINSYVFFKEPFEFYFGYIIYIVLLPVFIVRYGFNGTMFFIFLVLLVSGVVNVLLGNNTMALFIKVFTGLALSYFFYYYVVVEFNFDVDQLFRWYLKGAYIAAVIGLIQFASFMVGFSPGYNFRWVFNKWGFTPGGLFGIRINSVFAEPTHLGSVMSAAFFVAVYNLLQKQTYGLTRRQCIIIVLVYLLSFSSLGQTGIFVTVILLAVNFGLVRYFFVLVPAIFVLFNILYTNVVDFRDRLDGLVALFSGQSFRIGKIHGSSFILYNNYRVAMENFRTNFVFGTGIGSHPIAFEKYSMAKDIRTYGFNSNGADANSMLLRLISETGIFGVSIFLFLVFRFYVRRNPLYDTYHWIISNAILVMIILNLFRQGHYFLNGFPFFIMLYIFTSISYKNYVAANKPLS